MRLVWVVTAVLALAAPAHAVTTGFDAVAPLLADAPAMTSPLAVPSVAVAAADHGWLAARRDPSRAAPEPIGLSAERAQILLRSLTLPGWGQATAGHKKTATAFILAEAGVWSSFTAFRIQEALRKQNYERTARLFAGIDLGGRDEEFRRIIGSFLSSDEYNRLVVFRDAANLYYDDPAAYRAYIAEHELKGRDTWDWGNVDNLLRYRGQRKDAQRAALRSNTALALAVVNRLVSAIHAARVTTSEPAHSWELDVSPGGIEDPLACRVGVRTRF